jgi:dinuclear metal center YbgI/SA1388 family protein
LVTVRELVRLLDEWFPPRLAESWDNVGLLLGDEQAPVRRIMTTLSLTDESADEAIQQQADLVISHHPILFRKVSRLTAQGGERAAYKLARAGISLYSPHTSFDSGRGGINEQWAERLDLHDVQPLLPASGATTSKVVVFVPQADFGPVSQAMFAVGAGQIGEYGECSFRVAGTGTFRGSENSNPTVGQAGQPEEVNELRLEVVVPTSQVPEVIQAIRSTHSYEEPAYDIYPLSPTPESVGTGRQGHLSKPLPLADLARMAGRAVGASRVEIVGPTDGLCQKIAIGCGSASELMGDAARAGCDVFLTGEARFHDYLAARRLGIHLILVGHFESERFAIEQLAERLARQIPTTEVWASREESKPSSILTLDGRE